MVWCGNAARAWGGAVVDQQPVDQETVLGTATHVRGSGQIYNCPQRRVAFVAFPPFASQTFTLPPINSFYSLRLFRYSPRCLSLTLPRTRTPSSATTLPGASSARPTTRRRASTMRRVSSQLFKVLGHEISRVVSTLPMPRSASSLSGPLVSSIHVSHELRSRRRVRHSPAAK